MTDKKIKPIKSSGSNGLKSKKLGGSHGTPMVDCDGDMPLKPKISLHAAHSRRKFLRYTSSVGAFSALSLTLSRPRLALGAAGSPWSTNLGNDSNSFDSSLDATLSKDQFDVIVIGSGAAGMTTALKAAKLGLSVVVIEKASVFGGSTARSGAGIWIRNLPLLSKEGIEDNFEKAQTYLRASVGPESDPSRQDAYLSTGPEMIEFVTQNTPLRFRYMKGYSEYYPELPGGFSEGCSIEPEPLDGRLLGEDLSKLNGPYIPTPPGLVILGGDFKWLAIAAVNGRGRTVAAQSVARYARGFLKGQKLLSMGQALAAGLRAGLKTAQVPVWLDTSLIDLTQTPSGEVTGVKVLRQGQEIQLKANRGVVICSGGFEHNLKMRQTYQEAPIGIDWTSGAKTNTGDGIQVGEKAGAALDLMDSAWWGPSIPLPSQPYFCLSERSLPGSIMVNQNGERFVNESAPYTDVVREMYKEKAVPAWLIFDQNFRNKYLFKDVLPVVPFPKEWSESGVLKQSWTLCGLAKDLGFPKDQLEATVEKFNDFADSGVDEEFGRGKGAYDRYYCDPGVTPNPCLAALRKPPFYAVKLVPGDLGTKGGLLTDEKARVLRKDGSIIRGLYAAGNASASIMGRTYPAAGATLGPAMTFGYLAALDLAGQ